MRPPGGRAIAATRSSGLTARPAGEAHGEGVHHDRGSAHGSPLPSDSTMLRIVVDGPGWAAQLPAVPEGYVVTATVSSLELISDRGPLEERGYRFAGIVRTSVLPPGVETVDLVVPAALAADHPAWWHSAASCADRAFPLAFGPVLRALADLIRVHDLAIEPV